MKKLFLITFLCASNYANATDQADQLKITKEDLAQQYQNAVNNIQRMSAEVPKLEEAIKEYQEEIEKQNAFLTDQIKISAEIFGKIQEQVARLKRRTQIRPVQASALFVLRSPEDVDRFVSDDYFAEQTLKKMRENFNSFYALFDQYRDQTPAQISAAFQKNREKFHQDFMAEMKQAGVAQEGKEIPEMDKLD